MNSQHSDWLRQCAAAGHGGVTLPPIVRGVPDPFVMKWPGDVTADTFEMTMRLAPDAAGDSTLDFATSIGSYDGTYTPVTFTPDATKFDALPADGDGDGLVELVFDILRTPDGGTQKRALAGNLYISGKVTDGA